MPKRAPTRPAPRSRLEARLAEGAGRMGLNLTPAQAQQFIQYLELLQRWGQKINLTASLDPGAIIDHHFFDSLALWSVATPAHGDRLLDVGSGAGFPGVPLKIVAPSISLTLLEPRQKRAAFLQVVVAELGLTASRVEATRLADFSTIEPYSWIVARGVGRLAQLIEQAMPNLAPGGTIVLYASERQRIDELQVLKDFKMTEHRYRLPFSALERRLLLLRYPSGR
ncbi:MAG: 16S rRNA (guanine(527)-N(7))-methyltransferase RsmG [Nitrospirota bacterium]